MTKTTFRNATVTVTRNNATVNITIKDKDTGCIYAYGFNPAQTTINIDTGYVPF